MVASHEKDTSFTVPILINNKEHQTGKDHTTFDVLGPPSQKKIWSSQAATPETAKQAVEAAGKAFKTWSQTSPKERSEILLKAADIYERRSEEAIYYGQTELQGADDFLGFNNWYCINAFKVVAKSIEEVVKSTIIDPGDGTSATIHKVPQGVVLGISPWNAPLILGQRCFLAPIAAGNTVVMLSSPLSPMCHWFLAQVLYEAGLPEGVLNVLPGNPDPKQAAAVVEEILKNPVVKKCNFTGSTFVGYKINEVAGRYGKPTLMELGGKCSVIALEDADLDKLAWGLVKGAYFNSGQICMSTELAFIPKSIIANLLPKVKEEIAKQYPGPQPLIRNTSLEKLHKLLSDAESKGAKLQEGSKPDLSGSHSGLVPIVVTGISKEMDIWNTETFGPIFCIVEYDGNNVEEAIDMANELEFGLSVSVYSKDVEKAEKVALQIESGAIHINQMTVHDHPELPHGGMKGSGFGRFGGKWGLSEFLTTKTVTKPV